MDKVLFLITTLNGGGAEKILVDTVKALHNDYDITVMTILNRGIYIKDIKEICKYKYIFNDINANPLVKRIYFSLILRVLKIMPAKWQYNLFIHEKYNYEVAFLEGTPTKLLSGSTSIAHKYAWVHIDPKVLPVSTKAFINLGQERNAYKKFEMVACVSKTVRESMHSKFNLPERKTCVQFNILDEKLVLEKATQGANDIRTDNQFKLISIGRFMPQKNYLSLLSVCKKLKDDGEDYHLTLVGDGPQKNEIEAYISDNDLSRHVWITGFLPNPYPLLSKSNLFVCSSITEGFSTVVSEAIILGIPVLTTDCAGMDDILGHSEYGIIVENNEIALYEGIKQVIDDHNIYEYYKGKAIERSGFFKKERRIQELKTLIDNPEKM